MDKNQSRQWQNTYRFLPKRFYMNAKPAIFPDPQPVLVNWELAHDLAIDRELKMMSVKEQAAFFSGNAFPDGTQPISQGYGGHQFGYFSILGDGRAILLGERIAADGKRYDIQLKGSGATPYSRGGDGKAVIGPMLREYLISEAMHGLGIPTTRSLAVALTGEKVYRDKFESGAVLTRTAASHLRVGTFQFAYLGGKEEIKALADYAISRHDSDLEDSPETGIDNKYQKFLARVIERQAALIAKWQLVGFIHGVMNTDNMTISGETIDYGPCAFLDEYDPATVFSSIDQGGRYRYENQPPMGQWNLSRFADALLPLLDEEERAIALAKGELLNYGVLFHQFWRSGMKEKLGLDGDNPADEAIIADLLSFMERHRADYTNVFVRLTLESGGKDGGYLQGTKNLFEDKRFHRWKELWQKRQRLSGRGKEQIYQQMRAVNPFVIPRNFRVEKVLAEAEKGDYQAFLALLEMLRSPYRYEEINPDYQQTEAMLNYKTYCGT